jgi:hypothetical protein
VRELILKFACLPTATWEPCCGVLAAVGYFEFRVVCERRGEERRGA